MRIIKKICILSVALLLTGCAEGNKEWIPEEKEMPSVDSEQNGINITVTPEKPKEDIKITLTDCIKINEENYYSLKELKQVIEKELKAESDNYNLHMNTFYTDSNGFLCIEIEAFFDIVKNQCTLKKKYYLTDKSVYTEEETYSMEEDLSMQGDDCYLKLSKLAELFSWDYQIKENEQAVISDKHITFEKNSSVVYEPLVVDVVTGKYWSIAGEITDAGTLGADYRSRFTCTKPEAYVKVEEGEQLRFNFYCSWIPEVASILFMSDDDKVIQVYAYTQSNTLTNCVLTVPKGATKMHLSFFNNQNYQVDRVRYVEGVDLEQINTQEYEEQCLEVLRTNQKNSWNNQIEKSMDKAYITFVIDDCRTDMDVVADVFQEYGIPLNIAAIYQQFYNSASKGEESKLEVCRRVVKNGGEILAHNATPLTEELLVDFQTSQEHFYKDKKYLEAFGFDVQGIILAGGKGQVVGSQESDMWTRTHFSYSDLYGLEEKGEPYFHQRVHLAECRNNYKEIIEDAVKQKKWVSFYFHDLSEVDEKKLREILQYVSDISEEELEVTNYKTIYEKLYN